MNNEFIKVVKIKGNKVPWHYHDNSDELFYILEGELKMEIESESEVMFKSVDLFVVKKNTKHRVTSRDESKLMLIEHKNTSHTGNVTPEITKTLNRQIKYD